MNRNAIIILSLLLAFMTIYARNTYLGAKELSKELDIMEQEFEQLSNELDSHFLILDIDASCKDQLEHSGIIQLEVL